MNKSNRSSLDIFAEAGSAALYGAMMGLEVEADGNMAATGMVFDMAMRRFLDDVVAEGGADVAAVYASRLMKTLEKYTPDNAASPKKRA